jgi:hypothetical protein
VVATLPGVTIDRAGDDGWALRTPDGSLAAQYEHTVVVTRGCVPGEQEDA